MDIEKIKKVVCENCDESDSLVLAVSGGMDSVCMLDIVAGFWPLDQLIVAHVDHGVRDESQKDAEFVEGLATKYGVRYEGIRLQEVGDGNLEANLRSARYEFLAKVREKHDARYVLTAHHADDQAETVFMNFLRGSFVKGLGGMNLICNRKMVFRPMLSVRRSEIEEYARKLEFVEDPTNVDTSFNRNWLRHEILPAVEERFGGIVGRIGMNAKFYKELKNVLATAVENWIELNLKDSIGGLEADLRRFRDLPDFFIFMLIEKIFDTQLSQSDFGEIRNLIFNSQSGSHRQIGDKYLYISSEVLLISEFSPDELANHYFETVSKDLRGVRRPIDGDKYKGDKLKEYFKDSGTPWYYRKGVPVREENGFIVEVFVA